MFLELLSKGREAVLPLLQHRLLRNCITYRSKSWRRNREDFKKEHVGRRTLSLGSWRWICSKKNVKKFTIVFPNFKDLVFNLKRSQIGLLCELLQFIIFAISRGKWNICWSIFLKINSIYFCNNLVFISQAIQQLMIYYTLVLANYIIFKLCLLIDSPGCRYM